MDNVIASALSRDKAQVACSFYCRVQRGYNAGGGTRGGPGPSRSRRKKTESWERLWNFSSGKGSSTWACLTPAR